MITRLSEKEALILGLLYEGAALYGLEMVGRSRGQLKRGTVYVTLGRMEDKGLIRSWLQETDEGTGGLPRRIYEATSEGLRLLRAWNSMLRALKPQVAR